MMTPNSSHINAQVTNDDVNSCYKVNDDVFFGPDDLGRTFLTPSSSDASNLLLLSRTPFKHTRITPPQKHDKRREDFTNCSSVSPNNTGEMLISGDEELLFLNTVNVADSSEDMTIQMALAAANS